MDNPSGESLVNVSLDDLSQNSAVGSLSNAMTNNVYGFNHRQTPLAIPINKDHFGFTFFTRPQLNMQTMNIRNLRLMMPLVNAGELSYQRVIRCSLDPRLLEEYGNDDESNDTIDRRMTCPLVDNKQAFFPMLTNHLVSISGWQDITVPTYTGKEGMYKEGFSMVDGITQNYTTYDITATFRNSRGDPITSLFYFWSHYMSSVFEGTLVPYLDFIAQNEIDYNTRIYRIVLDSSKKYVQRIAATGAAFPIAVPIGGVFDYSNQKPYNDVNSEIAIPFRCMGAIYNDEILIWAFNKVVETFNTDMREGLRTSRMVKIPNDAYLEIFNNRGYPRINLKTYEFEWYVSKDTWDSRLNAYKNFATELGISVPEINNEGESNV